MQYNVGPTSQWSAVTPGSGCGSQGARINAQFDRRHCLGSARRCKRQRGPVLILDFDSRANPAMESGGVSSEYPRTAGDPRVTFFDRRGQGQILTKTRDAWTTPSAVYNRLRRVIQVALFCNRAHRPLRSHKGMQRPMLPLRGAPGQQFAR